MSTASIRGKRDRDLEQGDAPAGPNTQPLPLLDPALAVLLQQVIKSCLPKGKTFDELLQEINQSSSNYRNCFLNKFLERATPTAFPSLKEGDKVPLCIKDIVGRMKSGYYVTQEQCPELHTDAFKQLSAKAKKDKIKLAVGKGALTDLMELKMGYGALGVSCEGGSQLMGVCNALLKQLVVLFLPENDVNDDTKFDYMFVDCLDVEHGAAAVIALPDDVLNLLQQVLAENKVEKKWSIPKSHKRYGLWKCLQANESDEGSESDTSLNTVMANIKSGRYLMHILHHFYGSAWAGRTPVQKKELIQAAMAFGACKEMQWLRNGVDASTDRHITVGTLCGGLVREALAPLLPDHATWLKSRADLRAAILHLHRYFFLLDFRPALINQTPTVLVAGAGAPVAADANVSTNHAPVAGGGIHLPTASGPMPTQPPTSGDFAVLEACNSGLMTRIHTLQAEKEVAQADASQLRAALKAQKEDADATNKHLESKVAEMAAAQEKQAEENRHLQDQQAKELKQEKKDATAHHTKDATTIKALQKTAKQMAAQQATDSATIKALNSELKKAKAKNAEWKETFAGLAKLVHKK